MANSGIQYLHCMFFNMHCLFKKKKKKDLALEFEEIPQIRLNIFQVLIKINTF